MLSFFGAALVLDIILIASLLGIIFVTLHFTGGECLYKETSLFLPYAEILILFEHKEKANKELFFLPHNLIGNKKFRS